MAYTKNKAPEYWRKKLEQSIGGRKMTPQETEKALQRLEEEPKVREEYLQKLDIIRKGKSIKVDDFAKRYKN